MRSLLFFSFSLLILATGAVDIVDETCKKAAKADPQLSYDFCVTSLQADPRSKTADLNGLGLISMDLDNSKGRTIASYVTKLLQGKEVDPDIKLRLQDCSALYSAANALVEAAADYFKDKDYQSANEGLSAAMDDSSSCEDGFKKKPGLVSPLTKENKDYFSLVAISLAITNMFQ